MNLIIKDLTPFWIGKEAHHAWWIDSYLFNAFQMGIAPLHPQLGLLLIWYMHGTFHRSKVTQIHNLSSQICTQHIWLHIYLAAHFIALLAAHLVAQLVAHLAAHSGACRGAGDAWGAGVSLRKLRISICCWSCCANPPQLLTSFCFADRNIRQKLTFLGILW